MQAHCYLAGRTLFLLAGAILQILPEDCAAQGLGVPTGTTEWVQNSPQDEFEYNQGDCTMVYNIANVTNTSDFTIEARVWTSIYRFNHILQPELYFEFAGEPVDITPDSTEEVENADAYEWGEAGDYFAKSTVVIQFKINNEPVGGTNLAGEAYEADGTILPNGGGGGGGGGGVGG